jgi:hypothetical protein
MDVPIDGIRRRWSRRDAARAQAAEPDLKVHHAKRGKRTLETDC